MLEIKNLHVEAEEKKILKEINLKFEKGKIYVLMGSNGSGKTTFANVLIGNPKYNISSGKILFDEKDITNLPVNERAKKGLFLSFQFPTEISGITISNFLRTAYNSIKENKISFLDFQRLLEKKAKDLDINKRFLERYLNENFSGGEKKKMEILQMLVLNPKFVILDEIDSGLDIDSLKKISKEINNFMNKEKCILIITHHKEILDYIKHDKILKMFNGKII
jgi:Fe-S cluster assembly ATP-binding protein|tara:strand:+ start:3926 stop:4591 length:666 start_codon:yes stop_codon:yes gene_type:complete